MNIEGTYTLPALPTEVWQGLLDQQILLRTIPGVESIQKLDEGTYGMTIQVKSAPFKGSYYGRITVIEQQYPSHYRLAAECENHQNSISGVGAVYLHRRNNTTVITYKGTLTINKHITRFSPALIKGAIKLYIQQFFNVLADQLHRDSAAAIEGVSVTKQPGGEIIILPPPLKEYSSSAIFQRIAHVLRLGGGEALQEQRWGRRLQRMSIIAALLFLVWVGTRLPGRKLRTDKKLEEMVSSVHNGA